MLDPSIHPTDQDVPGGKQPGDTTLVFRGNGDEFGHSQGTFSPAPSRERPGWTACPPPRPDVKYVGVRGRVHCPTPGQEGPLPEHDKCLLWSGHCRLGLLSSPRGDYEERGVVGMGRHRGSVTPEAGGPAGKVASVHPSPASTELPCKEPCRQSRRGDGG